jgi:putative chitinase
MTNAVRAAFKRLFPSADPAWADALIAAAPYADIDTPREWAHWLGQLGHESMGFTRFEESLSYSAARLTAVWPRRFPSLAAAQPFARNGQALANKVYNGRMGNRVGSDDGWHFRGRGPKQLTGRENYTAFQSWLADNNLTDTDVRTAPDLLLKPTHGALSAAWFWHSAGLGDLLAQNRADRAAIPALTRRINGGQIGLADRRSRTLTALAALGGGS